jgi:hypothetical protein
MVKNTVLILVCLFTLIHSKAEAKVGFAFDFDQRFYLLKDVKQNIWGYRGGPYINQKFKCGIGVYYGNNTYFLKSNSLWAADLDIYSDFNLQLKQLGFSIYAEPVFYKGKYSEWSVVSEIAYFKNNYYILTGPTSNQHIKSTYIPAAVGISSNLKFGDQFRSPVFRWFGLNIMAGYRFDIYESETSLNMEGVHLSISSAIFLDKIWSDLKGWKKDK